MIKIGDFSKLSRISIRMLRHYAETGLLAPEKIDPFTGYRYYSEAQLPIANRITALKDMGFGLAAIGEILAQNPELYTFFSVHTYILTPYAASRCQPHYSLKGYGIRVIRHWGNTGAEPRP